MTRNRYRIRFTKTEAMRFTGHLDLQRAWERLLRRARIPIAYSAGFHPHPKIQIGAALPLGATGENELVDIETDAPVDPAETAARLNEAAPPGIRVREVSDLAEGSPGLEKIIAAGEYAVAPLDGAWPADLRRRIGGLLASPAVLRERRGKSYDLRPRVLSIEFDDPALRMRLNLAQEATGRPDEVLAALGLGDFPVDIRRTRLVLADNDGPTKENTPR
jgi:radical SAM-linked protein